MPILLAALLACLMLSTTAAAQEAPPADLDERVGLLFHIGMTALTEAEQADSDDAREKLYDRAIAAFRLILVNRPGAHTGAPGTGANVLHQGTRRVGAAAFRTGAGRWGAAAGGR